MSGNVTVSACNEAGGLFGAKVSGTGRLAAAGLCGFGKVGKERKALKLLRGKTKSEQSGGSDLLLSPGEGRWGDKKQEVNCRRRKGH